MPAASRFADVTRPVNVVLSPAVNGTVSNSDFLARGKAADNVGVAVVQTQINGGGWVNAASTNGWTNWTSPALEMTAGANLLQTYAVDGAGNHSLTNSVKFTYKVQPVADWAPDALNGLLVSVHPTNSPALKVGFDLTVFAQAGSGTNADDYGVGDYRYAKTSTNTAELTITNFGPPWRTNVSMIRLTFTNHYAAVFNSGEDSGTLQAAVATNFVPGSLAGRTLVATDGTSGKKVTLALAANGSFTKAPANNGGSGTSKGTYDFQRFSPVCGLVEFTFTGADAGTQVEVQLIFDSAKTGRYIVSSYHGGSFQENSYGTFVVN